MERPKMEEERPKSLDRGMLRDHGGWRAATTKVVEDAPMT